MRIALVSDTYTPQVNGVTTVLRRIVAAIGRARHHVAMVAPEYPNSQPDTRDDELRVPSVAFPPYPAIRLSLPAPRRVAHFLDAFAPDVVHVATEGPLGLVGRRYALRRGLPLATSFHTNFPAYCDHYGVPMLATAAWRFLTWFHRPARLVHAPGEAVRDALWQRGLSQTVVWGRGVNTGFFRPDKRDLSWRRRFGLADDAVLVLHVGRLASEKNLDTLADAWGIAQADLGPRAAFLLAGEGPLGERLAARMPWAIRLGFLHPRELATLYATADLCVLPSATETCGLVALEAMASGLPVVAADAGGFRESVAPPANGYLVPPSDARGFAASIVELARNVPLRRAMGLEARRSAVARDSSFEDATLIDQYAALTRQPRRRASRAA